MFQSLAHNYKSHDGFKLDRKIIINRSVNYDERSIQYWHLESRGASRLTDMDRIFHIVDGYQPKDRGGNAAALVELAMTKNKDDVDTDYFTITWYQNGNLHIRFNQPTLVEKVNQILSESDDRNIMCHA